MATDYIMRKLGSFTHVQMSAIPRQYEVNE